MTADGLYEFVPDLRRRCAGPITLNSTLEQRILDWSEDFELFMLDCDLFIQYRKRNNISRNHLNIYLINSSY